MHSSQSSDPRDFRLDGVRGHTATTLRFRAVHEDTPGPKWQRLARRAWPAYRNWFVAGGESARPSFLRCRQALERQLPELLPLWERLVELAGGSDLAARFLSHYQPPPYLSGCSQAVWTRGTTALVRNYDYHPRACEGTLLLSRWHDTRVLAMTEGLWGVLDGLNEHGLAVSLSFGGRRAVGDGFGIPLVLRYVLEFCTDAAQAAAALARIPSHMAYNVTLADVGGRALTVRTGPGRRTEVLDCPVATNHQKEVEWTAHAEATHSLEREQFLLERLQDPTETLDGLVVRFAEPPLWSAEFARGFGTLYTAVYRPQSREAEFRWPGLTWKQSIDGFREGELLMHVGGH